MALPKRGTRKITINDTPLRWLVAPLSDGFRLIVEHHSAPGQKLIVQIPTAAFSQPPHVVSPEITRQCVEAGIRQGFDPACPTGAVRLSIGAGELQLESVNREELVRRPVGRPRKRQPGEKRRPVYVSLEKEDRLRLEKAAAAKGLPIGTLAKTWILDRLQQEEDV